MTSSHPAGPRVPGSDLRVGIKAIFRNALVQGTPEERCELVEERVSGKWIIRFDDGSACWSRSDELTPLRWPGLSTVDKE
jgi:hypothetical protein